MTAFVTGATGFVGREVVRQLCVRGTRCVAHVRPDSRSLAAWRARFTELGAEVDTTAWDVGALATRLRALAPAQLYICIGTTRHKAKSDAISGDIYEAVDLGLTRIAVDAARTSEARPRLVYLSSVGASASARSPYLRARGKAEDVVRTSGLPWVIARPSFITGDRDEARLGEKAASVVGDGLLAVASVFGGRSLRAKYRSTTPDVLASALIRVGEAGDDRIVEGADLR
ncbi:MAG: NAD(P)H-binding protein [Deltaproteobacteria bacterium]|nr:NAD(P)H-binding protein [Deltaproteobacteria bacterium]